MGGLGADSSWVEGADARGRRPHRAGQGVPPHLPVRDGIPRPGQAGIAAALCGERAQLPHHARQRGEPLHDGARHGLPMGPLALSRRPHVALGAGDRSNGRLRVQGRLARRLRNELGRRLRRDEAVLRPRRELHWRQRIEGWIRAVSGRTVPAADGDELRGDDLLRRRQEPGLAGVPSPALTAHGGPQRPAPLPLLRQLRERMRRRSDVQPDRRHAAAGAQDRQPRDPMRQRGRARADEQREPRAGRHLHRAAHEEVGGRRREIRDPRRLDAREHQVAAALRKGRPRQFQRHARVCTSWIRSARPA